MLINGVAFGIIIKVFLTTNNLGLYPDVSCTVRVQKVAAKTVGIIFTQVKSLSQTATKATHSDAIAPVLVIQKKQQLIQ